MVNAINGLNWLIQKCRWFLKYSVLPCKGGEKFLRNLFEPLGYKVMSERHLLDNKFTEWGDSIYYTVEISKNTTVMELLNHLYVLIPVLDNHKHYYVDKAEIDKLLRRGSGWLENHPEKEQIAKRYLKYKSSYAREALARLIEINPNDEVIEESANLQEEEIERRINLSDERLGSVLSAIRASYTETIIDLGCGEGKLLKLLEIFKIIPGGVNFKQRFSM